MSGLEADGFAVAVTTLTAADARLAAIVAQHGTPTPISRPAGFPALVLIILEQQVSLASARATYDRLVTTAGGALTADAVGRLDNDALRAAGYSRQKIRSTRALVEAVQTGRLDLDGLASLPDAEVRASLCALVGVGPWSADVYLLGCLGRPDIWPVGDRALQVGVAETLGLDAVPTAVELEALGEQWRPHRSTAAHLLWHGYLARRGRTLPGP